jgi:hypothetical protein
MLNVCKNENIFTGFNKLFTHACCIFQKYGFLKLKKCWNLLPIGKKLVLEFIVSRNAIWYRSACINDVWLLTAATNQSVFI